MFKKSIILSSILLLGGIDSKLPASEKVTIEHTISIQTEETRKAVELHAASATDAVEKFDEISSQWHQYYHGKNGDFALETLLHATNFAAVKGSNIEDSLTLENTLWNSGDIRDTNVLVSALILGTLQDNHSQEDIGLQFGNKVLSILKELASQSNNPEEIKTLSPDAKLVLLASTLDAICANKQNGSKWDAEKTKEYLSKQEAILKALQGTNENLEMAVQEQIKNFS